MPNTKPAAGEAMPKKPKTISDMFEGPTDDARRMSSIMAGLLEDAFGKDMSEYGRPSCYYVTKQQVNDILFSIYKTQDYIEQIGAAMQEAIR